MKKMLLPVLVFTLSFPMLSCAASFDCAKAGTSVEKLICADEKISALDEQLAKSYKAALETATDKDAFKKEQVDWLKEQRNCRDIACLSSVYQSRLAKLGGNTTVAMEKSDSSARSSTATAKNPLHFTLVEGQGYPLCKQYVDMLNATKYPNMGALSCERKILPEYSLFKSPQWTEITDKNMMEKIIKERISIGRIGVWRNEQIDQSINNNLGYLKENNLRIFFLKGDFDKDGMIDTIYKFEIFYRVPDESLYCNYQAVSYVDDGKTTMENVKDTNPFARVRISGSFGKDTHFYYGGTIFNNEVAGESSVNIWTHRGNVICKISID